MKRVMSDFLRCPVQILWKGEADGFASLWKYRGDPEVSAEATQRSIRYARGLPIQSVFGQNRERAGETACATLKAKDRRNCLLQLAVLTIAAALLLSGCGTKVQADPKAEAPPAAVVEQEQDLNLVKVDHPEQFPLATAESHNAAPQLQVTGTISPDVSRNIPVVSLASGRVVEIHARLGDTVSKGQLLMRVQSADISQAFSDYRQAVADEALAKTQLDRAKLLYEKGAIAQKDLEVAQDTDTKAKITVENATERIRVLGADVDHPASIIDIKAPVSGIVTEQNVTAASGVKTLDNSPNLFTISDLSEVWIMCDVYENDLPYVRLGEYADIHLNAYPNMVLKGRVGNISPSLDPNTRTAKIRLEVHNPGTLRFGMFVTATFYGLNKQLSATVPASAVLHLHDRDWVYVPNGDGRFKRVEVTGGGILAGNIQEIRSGIQPGQQVVSNALVLQNTVEQ
ncbi:MAG TPA: efflux RND transporter periplasmic adaptor subunit [Bryobacteraceae bacterium]|nr:efflux RND transporter periplasmic adaptor subunit [Bryobacteraceae bacterium]